MGFVDLAGPLENMADDRRPTTTTND